MVTFEGKWDGSRTMPWHKDALCLHPHGRVKSQSRLPATPRAVVAVTKRGQGPAAAWKAPLWGAGGPRSAAAGAASPDRTGLERGGPGCARPGGACAAPPRYVTTSTSSRVTSSGHWKARARHVQHLRAQPAVRAAPMAAPSSLEAVKRKIQCLQQQADEAEDRAQVLQRELDLERDLREKVRPPGLPARLSRSLSPGLLLPSCLWLSLAGARPALPRCGRTAWPPAASIPRLSPRSSAPLRSALTARGSRCRSAAPAPAQPSPARPVPRGNRARPRLGPGARRSSRFGPHSCGKGVRAPIGTGERLRV